MAAQVAILGAGMAGLAAAAALEGKAPAVLYEEKSYVGGHASSHRFGDFIFDEGPHLSFTKNEHVRGIFEKSVDGRFLEHPGQAENYYQGIVLKHPAQCHLYPLPMDIKKKCLLDIIKAANAPVSTPANYKEWCYGKFGESFSEIFVRAYTRKYWTQELEELTTEWVGPRIYPPSLDEVLDGALRDAESNFNYIVTFRYPEQGGFVSFTKELRNRVSNLREGHRLDQVDPQTKMLAFANKKKEPYEHLISSLPLPALIDLMKGVPAPVKKAAGELDCTSHFLVNVGLRGREPVKAYWIYYYDEEIPFSRVSFPSRLSPGNVPSGTWSLQVEIVYSPYRPLLDKEKVVKECLVALKKVGLIKDEKDILEVGSQDIRYANVIFNHRRVGALKIVHEYLESVDIIPCGRYGEWAYLWTDECVLSGEKAAQKVLSRIQGVS